MPCEAVSHRAHEISPCAGDGGHASRRSSCTHTVDQHGRHTMTTPQGTPPPILHRPLVSPEQARFLRGTDPARSEGFARALAAPAAAPEIPPAPTAPPDMEPVLQAAADYGLEILGPPGIPA